MPLFDLLKSQIWFAFAIAIAIAFTIAIALFCLSALGWWSGTTLRVPCQGANVNRSLCRLLNYTVRYSSLQENILAKFLNLINQNFQIAGETCRRRRYAIFCSIVAIFVFNFSSST